LFQVDGYSMLKVIDGHGGFAEKRTHGMTRHFRRVKRSSATYIDANPPRSESSESDNPARAARTGALCLIHVSASFGCAHIYYATDGLAFQ
jgi:hypothetical protein